MSIAKLQPEQFEDAIHSFPQSDRQTEVKT